MGFALIPDKDKWSAYASNVDRLRGPIQSQTARITKKNVSRSVVLVSFAVLSCSASCRMPCRSMDTAHERDYNANENIVSDASVADRLAVSDGKVGGKRT